MFKSKKACTMVMIVYLFVCACGTGGAGEKSSGNDAEKKKPGSSFDNSYDGGSETNPDGDKTSQGESEVSGNGGSDTENNQVESGADVVYPDGNLSGDEKGNSYTFLEGEDAEYAVYDEAAMAAFLEELKSNTAEYGYDKLFNVEKSLEGVTAKTQVSSHMYSALDSNGKLEKDTYYELVKKNTAEYMSTKPMMVKAVDDATIREISDIIVDVVNEVLSVYPEIDKERVYCNLAQLKIGFKTSSTAYASVNETMFMHVNKSFSGSANLTDGDGFYRVIVHETMHLIQFGCSCETMQKGDRRFGLAHYYEDWETQYADWTWLGEGSAERMANLYMGKDPMTYLEEIRGILTFDVLAALREDLPANYVETICFYEDADRLFSLFPDCSPEEVCRMMYAFELAIKEPKTLEGDYERLYGGSWKAEEEKVKYTLENMAMTTLTRQFFCSLCEAIAEEKLTKNDVLFLLELYENSISQMTGMGLNRYAKYSEGFVAWYKPVRESFFGVFDNLSGGEFDAYSSGSIKNGINASLSWLPEKKINVLMEKYEGIMQQYRIK